MALVERTTGSGDGASEGTSAGRGEDRTLDQGSVGAGRNGSVPVQPTLDAEKTESHEALIARLFREHNQALIRFLMTRVDSEQEARDVAQEAYVRMLQLGSPGAISFLAAYLFKSKHPSGYRIVTPSGNG